MQNDEIKKPFKIELTGRFAAHLDDAFAFSRDLPVVEGPDPDCNLDRRHLVDCV